MKVLVTGATGFLGKYVIDVLIENSYEVIAIGRNEKRGKELQNESCTFYKIDFSEKEELEKIFKKEKIQYVIHCGALSSAWGRWEDFYSANVVGTQNVVEMCQKYSIKRLVHISSPSIYSEKRDRFDIKEDEVNENNKLNYYIKTKIMAEAIIKKALKEGIDAVIIRPRGLIGIGDPSLMPRIINANKKIGIPLFQDGKNLVDITCVENVAHACYLAMITENIKGEIFNITNDEPCEFKELLEEFYNAAEDKPKYLKMPFGVLYTVAAIIEGIYKIFKISKEPSLTRYTVCTLGFSQTLNIEKAKEKLNYIPKKKLKEGVIEYGKWWKENSKDKAL